jgi:hypothetical protein
MGCECCNSPKKESMQVQKLCVFVQSSPRKRSGRYNVSQSLLLSIIDVSIIISFLPISSRRESDKKTTSIPANIKLNKDKIRFGTAIKVQRNAKILRLQ